MHVVPEIETRALDKGQAVSEGEVGFGGYPEGGGGGEGRERVTFLLDHRRGVGDFFIHLQDV